DSGAPDETAVLTALDQERAHRVSRPSLPPRLEHAADALLGHDLAEELHHLGVSQELRDGRRVLGERRPQTEPRRLEAHWFPRPGHLATLAARSPRRPTCAAVSWCA